MVSNGWFEPLGQWSPTFLAPDIRFVEVNFSVDQVEGGQFQDDQVHYVYWALYFYYYYISSTSDFPSGSDGKVSAYNVEDAGSIPGSGRSPGDGNGNPFQYSCLKNPMDGGSW